VGPGPGPVTSYSDYMRCLAAKYNNNQNSPPAPTSLPSTLKHDLLPLLAAHQSAFPAFSQISLPGLSLFNPFLSQQNEVKPPVTNIASHPSSPREEPIERPKRPKEDPLDLTDKRLKREETHSDTETSNSNPRRESTGSSVNSSQETKTLLDWSVEEVSDFVSTVEDCSQYAKVFSENLIDGSCLPKLTETHLTTVMGIKLGPAIKLITSIKSLIPSSSSEATCLHCNHCHSSPVVSINQ